MDSFVLGVVNCPAVASLAQGNVASLAPHGAAWVVLAHRAILALSTGAPNVFGAAHVARVKVPAKNKKKCG